MRIALLALSLPLLAGAADTTTRVSVASGGGEAHGASTAPAIDASGRVVAFVSTAADLVAGDANGVADVFVRNRTLRTTSRVSVPTGGGEADGASGEPSISADGRWIAFVSRARNLSPDDGDAIADVYLRDRVTGTTTLVSRATGGAKADGDCSHPSVSTGGRYVAFASSAGDLAPRLSAGSHVFVRDVVAGTTEVASVAADGTLGRGSEPSLSGDGRLVAFTSGDALVAPDVNGAQPDVYVRDRTARTTRRVSDQGSAATSDSLRWADQPAISADGRVVVFTARRVVPDPYDTVYGYAVQAYDTATDVGTTLSDDILVGLTATPDPRPAVGADGRYVAFRYLVADLDGAVARAEIRRIDRLSGVTTTVSVRHDGTAVAAVEPGVGVARLGAVAFASPAADLVLGDGNGVDDVFVRGPIVRRLPWPLGGFLGDLLALLLREPAPPTARQ